MDTQRKPFQGVLNIIRFNWHFYVIAAASVLFAFFVAPYFKNPISLIIYVFCLLVLSSTLLSLLASLYVYDLFGFYKLNWIENQNEETLIVNINAGFDETSHLLQAKFDKAELIALDFYNPKTHTEISIKRARKAYPPFPKTRQIETTALNLSDNAADKIFVILSAHEIRNELERSKFFKELSRALKPNGQIYVTEHLRDFANFIAYNIGFFHFYPKSAWVSTFNSADLSIKKELKLTPFLSTFILEKNGNSY